jgi:DNA-binding LacI/PurR family transcriptional regulator
MAGIDDVKYASLLSVPLTTIHQPCEIMGAIAVSTMIERVRDSKLPARDILLNFHLVVRDSCGSDPDGRRAACSALLTRTTRRAVLAPSNPIY